MLSNFPWIELRRWLFFNISLEQPFINFAKKREAVKLSTRENSATFNYIIGEKKNKHKLISVG